LTDAELSRDLRVLYSTLGQLHLRADPQSC
jgi:hypothetical protein